MLRVCGFMVGLTLLSQIHRCTASVEILELEIPQNCARKVSVGDLISIHYNSTVYTSADFDSGYGIDNTHLSTITRGAPLQFVFGSPPLPWDEGLRDMCVNETRTFTVDGEGYGILENSTLKYEVECVGISDNVEPNIFAQMDMDDSGGISKSEMSVWFQKTHGTDLPDGIWDNEDANRDGVISWEEFSGPKVHGTVVGRN